MTTRSNNPKRALVLQGGVALGAYEAGVVKALCDELSIKAKDDENIFDIVCGTSAGAINAALLVSYIVDSKRQRQHLTIKQRWYKATDHLIDFWHYLSSTPSLYYWWPFYSDIDRWKAAWDDRHRIDSNIATGEAARRYYSTKEFFYSGAPHVFSSFNIKYDNRFSDTLYPPTNNWYLYNNLPLRDSIVKYSDFEDADHFRIKTDAKKGEPRLLTVAVDVQEARAIAFDSDLCVSTYLQYDTLKKRYEEHKMNYPKGLTLKHVMASGSFPLYFTYEKIEERTFWDGGLLSNTPLRELLQAHRDYYYRPPSRSAIPELEVYVVNVWPSHERHVPSDYDGVKDRRNDITYADKTEHDQRVALSITDYIDLFEKTKAIADEAIDTIPDQAKKSNLKQRLRNLLENTDAKSTTRLGQTRKYKKLVEGKVKLTKITTIERIDDDPDSNISNKWADFSSKTISDMIQKGMGYHRTAIVKTL